MISFARVLCGLGVLWLWTATVIAAPCAPWVTRVVSIEGTIEVKRQKQGGWSRIQLNDEFCAGDSIRADIHSRAGLLLRNETLLRLDQGTTLVLPQFHEEDSAWLELVRGAVHFISNVPYRLKIKTPFVNAAIEGTEFAVRVSEADTKVWVLEGKVLVDNSQGSISLGPGDAAVAEAGKPPVPYLKIKPRDAVQWALHYPPIIDYRSSTAVDPQRQRAVTLYRTGQIPAAIEALNAAPETARDSGFFTQRAAILLTVGQVQSAQKDIDKALALSPNSGAPRALQSVIALTQNDKAKALSLAQEAVKLEPKSPTPQVALSYAQQAAFDIEGARESIKKALELAPDDPLAWARLSELELSTGELDDALDSAKKAEALDPELSRTQMVLGFAQLTEIDIDEAKASFTKAIALDPSAPLPRLGMGLAKIRQGDVEQGRKDIEVAAVLDPENSLIRSYLGKAYYEEKRGNVASREFAMAKQLDPKDPTPWFYDAIYKQTVNRPVEALHDMQKAIELNDNRAVYRSSLLLDDDLAARSASLGRIYNNLGFQERGLLEGWKSVNTDPGNYSAHRFLADNYSVLPRHEVARVSELLRSQLLQPINITPVQPQLAESSLLFNNRLGSSALSFNEFNPLFERNRFALQASGVLGSNYTFADQVTQSGVWNNFSYSIGQLHNQTDGARVNNDVKEDIYNIFTQIRLTSELSVQAEFRHKDLDHGDIQSHFDAADEDPNFRRNLRSNTYRAGAHYSPAPHSDFIVSAVYLDQLETSIQNFGTFTSDIQAANYIVEGQYLFSSDILDITVGGGFFRLKQNNEFQSAFFGNMASQTETRQRNGYLYSNIRFPDEVIWTLGLSFDELDDTDFGLSSRWNPKLGLIWDAMPGLTFRAAAIRTTARSLISSQTIEPTQVAGFNQFFDDRLGTDANRYGIGLDYKVCQNFYLGFEASKRKLKVPIFFFPREKWEEQFYRAYINWTPTPNISMNIGYMLERFRRKVKNDIFTNPARTTNHIIPIGLRYFHPSGFFGALKIRYVNQNVEESTVNGIDEFVLADAEIGYRLPKRYGVFTLGISNIFDENFRFESLGIRSKDQDASPFVEGRNVTARVTLSFF